MIVRRLADIRGTDCHVKTPEWESVRLLLARDGMGFSFHITTFPAGSAMVMHYTNHLEAVYCISGSGRLFERDSGLEHAIEPGTLYALNAHDRHRLEAHTELVLACVFNPPLVGKETHDASGSYPRMGDGP